MLNKIFQSIAKGSKKSGVIFPHFSSFQQTATGKMDRHYVITYKYVAEFYYKRGRQMLTYNIRDLAPFKDKHDSRMEDYISKGNALLSGPFYPMDGGLAILKGKNEVEIHNFVREDTYYKNNLIAEYWIQEIDLKCKKTFDELVLAYEYPITP